MNIKAEKQFCEQEQTFLEMKIREYISELEEEIERCILLWKEDMDSEVRKATALESRIQTLTEVKNDLESRLNEVL